MPTRGLKAVPDEENLFKGWEGTVAKMPFTFRELSVKENDEAVEAAKNPDGTTNGRLLMRLMVIRCSVEPKLTSDSISKLPHRIYLRLCDVVTELNAADEEGGDEDEGKD